jgi:hypothetical protein
MMEAQMQARTDRLRIAGFSLLAVGAAVTMSAAHAIPTVNLAQGTVNGVASATSGTINGANYIWDKTQTSGTGMFVAFERLDVPGNNGTEQGYNTNASNVFQNKEPVNYTRDVLLSELKTTTDGNGKSWVEFILDINELGGGNPGRLISLDGVRIYSTANPGQSSMSVDSRGDANGITGTLLYEMEGRATDASGTGNDQSVMLDGARDGGTAGSGTSDMRLQIAASEFEKVKAGETHLVLWSRFGLLEAADSKTFSGAYADAGFEEWAFRSTGGKLQIGPPPPQGGIPLPSSVSLALLGLVLLGGVRRSRQSPQASVLAAT